MIIGGIFLIDLSLITKYFAKMSIVFV